MDKTERSRRSYDSIRGELKDRGYFEGPVERFILGGAGIGPDRRIRLFRPAVRAAVVGGVVLAALLAAATAVANRPLLDATDLALLWLYFAPLAAIALLAIDLVTASILLVFVRRRGARRGDPLRAALFVALPTAAYLSLLWSSDRPGRGWVEEIGFAVAAILATVLVAWLAGLVSLAGIIGTTGEVPQRGRRAALILILVAIPLAAGIFIARPSTESRAGREPDPVAFDISSEAPVTLLVGIDGLDAGLLQRHDAAGSVDGLLDAFEGGAVFPLHRREGGEPPEAWTTLMTGMRAVDHGVTGVGSERLPGIATPLSETSGPLRVVAALRFLLPSRTVPTTSAFRSVRTLWEIVALRRPSLAIGWWASWPVEPGQSGWIVSDRVLAKLISGAAGDRDTAPASLFDRLEADFEEDRRAIRERFQQLFSDLSVGPIAPLLWESYLIDAYAARIVVRLTADDGRGDAFVYLPGLDILRARLARGVDAGEALPTTAALAAYLGALDDLLVPLIKGRGDRGLILVADPGRVGGPGAEGLLLALSPRTIPACVGPPIDLLDVAPFVLSIVGFPLSDEMPGRAPLQCLRPPSEARPAGVRDYGRRALPSSEPISEYDPELVERLKSLGYLN